MEKTTNSRNRKYVLALVVTALLVVAILPSSNAGIFAQQQQQIPKPILKVNIITDKNSGPAPLTVNFNSTVSGGTGEDYLYFWDFGSKDISRASTDNTSRVFKEAGTYNVTFGAIDPELNYGLESVIIKVTTTAAADNDDNHEKTKNYNDDNEEEEEPNPEPDNNNNNTNPDPDNNSTEPEPEPEPEPAVFDAVITLDNITGIAPATFTFVGAITGGTEPYTYSWDFDEDGTEDADEQTATHTFELPGRYEVELEVTDDNDESTTANIEVNVINGTTPTPNPDPEPEECPEGTTGTPPDDCVPIPDEECPEGTTGTPPDCTPIPDPDPDPEPTQDVFGIDMLYPTVESGGPTWHILEQEDPTDDGYFYYGLFETTTIDYQGSGVWQVDAQSGTQEHGIRMHVDSPTGKWKNTEMTGYFFNHEGSDQFTMIARHGPSYHDEGGCLAYGYYGMTEIDGDVFFKKKLYHFGGGYTQRLAQVRALEDLDDRWIGMKFVVYDLPNGDIKLELWIDDGDMTNNWEKVTELIDKGNLAVTGGDDCGREATDTIDSGTRASFRADDTLFDYKKLSVREIEPPS